MASNNNPVNNNYQQGGNNPSGGSRSSVPASYSGGRSAAAPAWGGGNTVGHLQPNYSATNNFGSGDENVNVHGIASNAAPSQNNNGHLNMTMNVNANSWQQQQNQHAAMYVPSQHQHHQHYPHHTYPPQMISYQHQQQQHQQYYMQQHAAAHHHRQQYYMHQTQYQHQHHQQKQAQPETTLPANPTTPATVFRTSYYATHGNAPTAASVPAVSWPTSGSSNASSNTVGNPGAGINNTHKQVGMWQQNYPTQYNQGHNHNPYSTTSNVTSNTNNANMDGSGGNPKSSKKISVITDKDGKPLDLSGISSTSNSNSQSNHSTKSSSASQPPTINKTTSQVSSRATPASSKSEDAGAKLRAAAERNLKENVNAREERERLEKERLEKEKLEKERLEKERLEKERLEKEKLEKERLEKERLEKERLEKERLEKERLEKERLEKERLEKERLEKESSRKSPVPVRVGLRPGGFRPGGGTPTGLRPGGPSLRPGGGRAVSAIQSLTSDVAALNTNGEKKNYTKAEILALRDLPICIVRPTDLPNMTVTSNFRGQSRGQTGRQAGSQWARGNVPLNATGQPRNGGHSNYRHGGQDKSWTRGEAPPQRPPRGGRGGRGGRGHRQNHHDEYLGPVAPLVKSENRWMPQKNNSVMVATEKKVKGILNKMTKEKFGKLSTQMCDIPILSYEMLTMIIHRVYEKAIDEPAFGDMYADLCCRLAEKVSPESIIEIIRSNEEKPDLSAKTYDAKDKDRWRHYEEGTDTWRWTNDAATDDNDIVGPFDSIEDCYTCALEDSGEPSPRGDTELTLVECRIIDNVFCKVTVDDKEDKYYTVYFAVEDAEKCNQQLSKIYPTEELCKADALKQNSFKRTLLNKCEDEFTKQDIYIDWKKEMKAYQETKDSLTENQRAEKEEELDFRRMKIKKQMLGNIKFIGELYKKNMIRENIMHFCIQDLLKMDKDKDDEMDEEDHEALCNLFSTIGKTLDTPKNEQNLRSYFKKMKRMSEDEENLSFRSRFMYKDLIDLRKNGWKVRREELKAKTINEIRREAAREEKQKEQQNNYNRGQDYRGDSRRTGAYNSNRRDEGGNRGRSAPVVDSSGFTQVSHGRGTSYGNHVSKTSKTLKSNTQTPKNKKRSNVQSSVKQSKTSSPNIPNPVTVAPLSDEKFNLRTKNICAEFMQDSSNTKELFLSFDELTGTPEAGKKFTQICIDQIVDMKYDEIMSMVTVLVILFQNEKLTSSDIEFGLGESIEFLDSFIYDCPKVFTYYGDILSKFLNIKAFTVSWICDVAGRMMGMKKELIDETIRFTIANFGKAEASTLFLENERLLEKLLGSPEWEEVKGSHF